MVSNKKKVLMLGLIILLAQLVLEGQACSTREYYYGYLITD